MADDELILGHRNSEWTGLGPVMEEDIAFSSMAQDKIGHAWALYRILQEHLGGEDPDAFAFLRAADKYTCCHLVEQPNGSYDFSLVRHFLFDHAEAVRYEALLESSFVPLQQLARKIRGELKYHTLHADAFMIQLGNGNDSNERMQQALNTCLPMAFGIFERDHTNDQLLMDEGITPGEEFLQLAWLEQIAPVIAKAGLQLPTLKAMGSIDAYYGGRSGRHTPYLGPLLEEMGAVFRLDPQATW